MSFAGNLLLRATRAARGEAVRQAEPRPRPVAAAAAAGDPGHQRRHRVRPPSRLRCHRDVPGLPGAGAHLQLRRPGAVHQRGDARTAQPADQASAGAVHDHQRDDRSLQVHPHDQRRQARQVTPDVAVAVGPVSRPPGDRRRPDAQRRQPRDRVVLSGRHPLRFGVRARLPDHARAGQVDVHRPLRGVRHRGLRGQVLHPAAAGRRPGHQLHRHRQPEHDHPAGRPARHATPKRSSATCGTGRCRPTSPSHQSYGRRCT